MNTSPHPRAIGLLHVSLIFFTVMLCHAAAAGDFPKRGSFYLNAGLGSTFVADTTLKSTDLVLESGRVKFNPGGRLDFGFGYHLTEWLAAELETGVAINVTDKVGHAGNGDGLGFYQIPILANVVFDIPTHSRFKPFLGAGIGGVETELEDYDLFDGRSADDFGLAWQGFAGARYALSSRVELGLVYKYLGTTERTFDSFHSRINGTQTHSVLASVLFKF